MAARRDSSAKARLGQTAPAAGLRTRTLQEYVIRQGFPSGPAQDAFLHPKLSSLTAPDGMVDRQRAAERLAHAIRRSERIVLFGDYDCDGMTSAALLADAMERLGGHVATVLANRFEGGYGLSAQALLRIRDKDPSLVVTCDCGSSDHETIAELAASGVDVIVVDHHLVPDEPLAAVAFLNPHRPDCQFPFKWLASCGLVLSLAGAVRAALGVPLDLREFLDLVAIGTIADVAPLEGDNRILVRAGLEGIRHARRPGIVALCELLGIDGEVPVTASDVAFRIAPRLNAPGRLESAEIALALLREKSPSEARLLAEKVDQLCTLRRAQQSLIEVAANEQLATEGLDEAAGVVLGKQGWNHGIVGIVAGRLAERLGKPCLVIGFEGQLGSGSVRGPKGFPLFDAVQECRAHLLRFGGHQAAAGVTVRLEELAALRSAFASACARRLDFAAPAQVEPLTLLEGDTLPEVLQDLYLLEPCGAGNPLPELAVQGAVVSARSVRGGHLKVEIKLPGGERVGGFGPQLGAMAETLSGDVVLLGGVRADRFSGGGRAEMLVRGVQVPHTE